eukprot:jgi/Chrzof1/14705/Cz09g12210.t1
MAKKRREKIQRHKQDLGDQLEDPNTYGVRIKPRAEKKRRRAEEDTDELVSQKISSRILKEARAQQEEIDFDDQQDGAAANTPAIQISQGALTAALQRLADSDDDDEDHGGFSDTDSMWDVGDGDADVSPEEEAALAAFMATGAQDSAQQQKSLADLVLGKIRDKQQQAGIQTLPEHADEAPVPEGLDDKVVEMYTAVGALLKRYTTGKIPKAFKIIPSLHNWEDVLYLTDPEGWSPHAMYAATKMFVSNLNARLAQRFLALVLLPRVRSDIAEHKRLHFALFQALKKATYKPGAFFKGLLLPLCQSRTCTLREAVIFSSVLKRASLPVLHSAAALLRMAQMEYCGTTSFFVRVLLDKKYALPYKVVDALVAHFTRFADDERQMPVVWHQCLLCFVQRYKHEIKEADKEALRKLVQQQHHYQVSPEVLRELDHGAARDNRGSGAAQAMQVEFVVGKHVVEDVRNLPPVPMMDDE